eukprot:5924960-Amphidinium_carterae.1
MPSNEEANCSNLSIAQPRVDERTTLASKTELTSQSNLPTVPSISGGWNDRPSAKWLGVATNTLTRVSEALVRHINGAGKGHGQRSSPLEHCARLCLTKVANVYRPANPGQVLALRCRRGLVPQHTRSARFPPASAIGMPMPTASLSHLMAFTEDLRSER